MSGIQPSEGNTVKPWPTTAPPRSRRTDKVELLTVHAAADT